MKSSLTAKDVLSDIEFELVQGAISRNELGQSIQAIKQHQNKVRSEVLQPSSRVTDSREIAARQFQINDMLITLLQEIAASLQALELRVRRAARFAQSTSATTPTATISMPEGPTSAPAVTAIPMPEVAPGRETHDIENAMQPGTLYIGSDVRAPNVPILGGLVKWLRLTVHNLVLFYVARLAGQQTHVNQTYGDWILYLNRLNLSQQEQIELLSAQVAALQARLNELERSSGRRA